MFYIYILRLCDGSYYKGQTQNIDNRLKEHYSGNVKTTKNKFPFKIVHVELCESRKNSRKLKKYFKSGYGREIIHELDS